MLKQLKTFSILVILLMSNVSWADNVNNLQFKMIDETSFVLSFAQESKSNIDVSFVDTKGVIILFETISNAKIENRKYNLKALPNGNYNVVISYDKFINIQEINKSKDGIKINPTAREIVHTPEFVEKDGLLGINLLCNPETSYSVQIQDEAGKILFQDYINNKIATQKKRFDFSKLPMGNYTISVDLTSDFFAKNYSKKIELGENIASK